MKNQLQTFSYNNTPIRTVEKNGEPWWVLKDVCDVLDISDTNRTAERLDEDELTRVKLVSGGQNREMYIINESGLYNVILRSDKPQAKPFRKWVTSEVLPSIRKTGAYTAPTAQTLAADKRASAMLINAKARVAASLRQLYDRAGVKPEYQAMAMSDFFADDGIILPRIALQSTKVTYDKGTIADKLGVLSKAGKPHALAIGGIIAQVDVLPEEMERVPYCRNGHDGADVQYTDTVIAKVKLWLERNEFPKQIAMRNGKVANIVYRQR